MAYGVMIMIGMMMNRNINLLQKLLTRKRLLREALKRRVAKNRKTQKLRKKAQQAARRRIK